MKRDTIGKIATDLQTNIIQESAHTISERIQAASPNYKAILHNAYLEGLKNKPNDFYIELCVKVEKLLWNVDPRWIPHVRDTCPTPCFNQSVYRYNKKDDCLEYMWTIPDIHSCVWMLQNALNLPDEQRELLNYVLDFKDGKLKQICLDLNDKLYKTIH